MFLSKIPRQAFLVLLVLVLTACNIGSGPTEPTQDADALVTAIAGTAVAQFSIQFTQTALAQPSNTPAVTDTALALPTFSSNGQTPLPTFDSSTPAAVFTSVTIPTVVPSQALGDDCHNSVFEADVTIPDGSVVKGGETLQKIWKIRNTGSCPWDEGYTLVHIGGSIESNNFQPENYEFQSKDTVESGEAINLAITFNAPCKAGKYEAHWRMQTDAGYYFGTLLSMYIEVKGKTGGCP